MDLSIGVISPLLTPLLSLAKDDWSNKAEFKTLRHLAYERLSRELHWNAECLWKVSDDSANGYIDLLRTEAFDALVAASVPLDFLLREQVRADWLETEPYCRQQFKHRIESCEKISHLVDRVYNRIWMLKNREKCELGHGDIQYLVDLLLFTLAHVNMCRRDTYASRNNLRKSISQLIPGI
jgi:hypothetical protein